MHRTVFVNYLAPMAFVSAFAPMMKQRGNGHIINICSTAGDDIYPNSSVYCSTKAALHAYTEAARHDLVDTPIRVTSISPGLVDTPLHEKKSGDYRMQNYYQPQSSSPGRSYRPDTDERNNYRDNYNSPSNGMSNFHSPSNRMQKEAGIFTLQYRNGQWSSSPLDNQGGRGGQHKDDYISPRERNGQPPGYGSMPYRNSGNIIDLSSSS